MTRICQNQSIIPIAYKVEHWPTSYPYCNRGQTSKFRSTKVIEGFCISMQNNLHNHIHISIVTLRSVFLLSRKSITFCIKDYWFMATYLQTLLPDWVIEFSYAIRGSKCNQLSTHANTCASGGRTHPGHKYSSTAWDNVASLKLSSIENMSMGFDLYPAHSIQKHK